MENNVGMKPLNKITSYRSLRHFPGRPLAQRFSPKEEDCESKIEKFQVLLESYSLSIGDLCQLSWSGVPVKVCIIPKNKFKPIKSKVTPNILIIH